MCPSSSLSVWLSFWSDISAIVVGWTHRREVQISMRESAELVGSSSCHLLAAQVLAARRQRNSSGNNERAEFSCSSTLADSNWLVQLTGIWRRSKTKETTMESPWIKCLVGWLELVVCRSLACWMADWQAGFSLRPLSETILLFISSFFIHSTQLQTHTNVQTQTHIWTIDRQTDKNSNKLAIFEPAKVATVWAVAAANSTNTHTQLSKHKSAAEAMKEAPRSTQQVLLAAELPLAI